jgi:hypothetical protein
MSLKREFKLLRKTLGRAWRDEKMRGLPRSPPSRKNAGLTKVPTSRKNNHTPIGRKIVSFSLRKFGARPSCDITHLQSAEADPFFEAPHYDYCYRCESGTNPPGIYRNRQTENWGGIFLPISPGLKSGSLFFFHCSVSCGFYYRLHPFLFRRLICTGNWERNPRKSSNRGLTES